MITRADIVRAIINDNGYYFTKHSVLEIVHYIFDEHERKIIHLKHIEDEVILLRDRKKELEIQLKAKDEEIERLKAKIHCLENDSIVLNMEQRLIDIALVLDGKLTSKDNK